MAQASVQALDESEDRYNNATANLLGQAVLALSSKAAGDEAPSAEAAVDLALETAQDAAKAVAGVWVLLTIAAGTAKAAVTVSGGAVAAKVATVVGGAFSLRTPIEELETRYDADPESLTEEETRRVLRFRNRNKDEPTADGEYVQFEASREAVAPTRPNDLYRKYLATRTPGWQLPWYTRNQGTAAGAEAAGGESTVEPPLLSAGRTPLLGSIRRRLSALRVKVERATFRTSQALRRWIAKLDNLLTGGSRPEGWGFSRSTAPGVE